MNYNKDTFLGLSSNNIKILDLSGSLKYTINPDSVFHLSVSNNLVKIELKDEITISLDFSDYIESTEALYKLQIRLDYLRNATGGGDNTLPYKVIRGLFYSGEEGDFEVRILENTTGSEFVWTQDYDGRTLTGTTDTNIFIPGKVHALVNMFPDDLGGELAGDIYCNENTITIKMFKTTVGDVTQTSTPDCPFEIKIYN